MQIHLTKKLCKLLGVQPELVEKKHTECSTLGVWYANIFEVEYDPYLSHRENSLYLLLVNTESLVSFSMSIPEELTVEHFFMELPPIMIGIFDSYGFNSRQLAYIDQLSREIVFTKAIDGSMLGYLRAFAYDHADQIREESNLESLLNSSMLNWDINRISRPDLAKQNPIACAKRLVNQALRRAI